MRRESAGLGLEAEQSGQARLDQGGRLQSLHTSLASAISGFLLHRPLLVFPSPPPYPPSPPTQPPPLLMFTLTTSGERGRVPGEVGAWSI